MRARTAATAIAGPPLVLLVAILACLPWLLSDYELSLALHLLSYLTLTVAWAMFSGTTRLVSLATSAFFGVGMYTVAMLVKLMPLEAIFAVAAGIGAVLALVVGIVTLRISGMFFVIFGFGLSEMMRQLMVWWEINKTFTMGRYVRVNFDNTMIYEHLLGLCVLAFAAGFLLRRSRLGIAALVIGEDETVARQVGIDVPFVKLAIFVLSCVLMTLVGAVMAPRFGFINPNIAFNPLISFQVVIMALLGGLKRLWGPILGVLPLIALSETLEVEFPFWYSILLGLVFMAIVYFLPRGAVGLIDDAWERLGRPMELPRGYTGWLRDAGAGVARAWAWLSRPRTLPGGFTGPIEGWAKRQWRRLVPEER